MKKVELVKVELVEDFCGMTSGTIKEVPQTVASNLIERGRAKAVEEKPKKATKKEDKPTEE